MSDHDSRRTPPRPRNRTSMIVVVAAVVVVAAATTGVVLARERPGSSAADAVVPSAGASSTSVPVTEVSPSTTLSASTPASPSPTTVTAPAPSTAHPTTTARSTAATTRPRSTTAPAPAASGVTPPPVNAGFDYQIGGPYTVPSGVRVVSRDHDTAPAAGIYSICYVNAFQTQTESAGWWTGKHPDLLVRDGSGYLVDPDWDEMLLDISTAAKRTALAGIVDGWIDQCADKGFRAVEPDNLDSWTRSGGRLTRTEAIAYASLITRHAHARGLAVAQKNGLDLGNAGRAQVGFDFAVAEDCMDYTMDGDVPECQGYVNTYGAHVIVIEYASAAYRSACSRFGSRLSITFRDRDVTTPGSGSYQFATC